jgi:two-component system response regulator GlrR
MQRAGAGMSTGEHENKAALQKLDVRPASLNSSLLGESAPFLAAVSLANRLGSCGATVLIEGETGTGKELLARAIHYGGARARAPFVPVNCGCIPEHLVESELFGHVRGAFTDARDANAGLVAQAEGGTLFLDEVEVMSPRAQVALLRFLQDKHCRPVGGAQTRCADVRILAATNADLSQLVSAGRWREDLMYRLQVVTVRLPPLRERGRDVMLLAKFFSRRFAESYGVVPRAFHPDAEDYLQQHRWPGNVRELENLIHRQYLVSDATLITAADCRPETIVGHAIERARPDQQFHLAKAEAVEAFERGYLTRLLRRANGNLSLAARLAGKERSGLGKLVRKYGLHKGDTAN